MNDDALKTALLDLWEALGPAVESVLLGGGYGLYLKQQHLAEAQIATLIPADLWPVPRATQDLDLLLSAELVGSVASMQSVRNALDKLGYRVVKGSEFLQFERDVSNTQVVKVDLLTAQLGEFEGLPGVKADDHRARPTDKSRPQLHAHPTDGAIRLTESNLTLQVSGTLTNGATSSASVRIPHPFTYLLMKLTAYRDRKNDPEKDLGRHHALDIFRIMAMMTEQELNEVSQRIRQHQLDEQAVSCREVASSDFMHRNAPGVLAMRSHALWQNDDQLDTFVGAVYDLFNL